MRCTFGERSLVPDVAVFRTECISRDNDGQVANVFNLPPDWTIEILSPHQSQTQVVRNILHCLDYGTKMGWLLDPEESSIFVYGSDRSVRIFEEIEECLPVPEFAEAVQLKVEEIFAWLRE